MSNRKNIHRRDAEATNAPSAWSKRKPISRLCVSAVILKIIMALAKRIIPCLDVDNGRVVKGVKFVEIRDAGNPVEVARRYDEEGADELTFLDITASSDDRETIVHVVEDVANEVFIPLTVGGGIRTVEDIAAC